jgi:hypothetical protein
MAQRDDDTGDAAHDRVQDDESSFVATARDVIARRETLLDALDE